jgi:hypothetical protein
VGLRVIPLSLDDANAFVVRLHRHNGKLPGCRFSIGAQDSAGVLRGVAICGNPAACELQKLPLFVLEIRRVCTDGARNACSLLYGACRRAAQAQGYDVVFTYSLPSEGGASLRGAGFVLDREGAGDSAAKWASRPGRAVLPVESDLLGGKWRWVAWARA